ncbi:MAG: type VI secretion system tube protein Hcp [Candidatus Krumholzibacteria bacterium]|nr:type VI secretion system tube protein Hcp [Candidatus Krumholzibacteria bacterium]
MYSRIKPLFCLALVTALLTVPSMGFAALHLVIQATGSNQGPIPGDSTVPGYQDAITLASFQHGVGTFPGQNGVPGSQPSVSELTVSANFDRATVRLMDALANSESFTSFRMDLVDDALGAKMPMTLLRYELVGAYVTSVSESAGSGSMPSVSYSFSYSQIIISDLVEGTSVTYYWTPPLATAPESFSKGILLTPTPNPTYGQTEFRFSLPSDSNAQLTLFDLRGYRVKELHSGWTSSEPMAVVWDGTDERGMKVAQGVYMARLVYPGREISQRITILR